MAKKAQALKYVGDGVWIRGIPARDLDADEVERLSLKSDELIASGLYEADTKAAKAKEE